MRRQHEFWRQTQALRLPLLITVAAALIFTLPDQTKEIYRALTQIVVQMDWTDPARYQSIVLELGLGAAGITTLSLLLWFTARRSASHYQLGMASDSQQAVAVDFSKRPWALLWLPRLFALAIPLSAAFGMLLSDIAPEHENTIKDAMVSVFKLQFMHDGLSARTATRIAVRSASNIILFSDYLVYFAAILSAVGAVLVLAISWLDRPWLARRLTRPAQWSAISVVPPILTLIIFVGVITTSILSPVAIPQKVGAIFILCLFLIFLLLILLQLQTWHRKTGIPFTALLIVFAVMFSVLDWNDNHAIRSLGTSGQIIPKDDGFAKAFKRWLDSRADFDRYANKPYPIYIVAAQGGGIYAASHAASFMAELQDLCPGFAHHLFAISSVSGGSVGASVFAALTQEIDWKKKADSDKFGCVADLKAKRPATFSLATTSIFRRDLWSPLSAGMLFPDFLQRFIFFPIDAWDRSLALEYALEDAYKEGLQESRFPLLSGPSRKPLTKSYLAHWNPEKKSHTPALLLNTTDVGLGRRRVVAPFSFRGIGLDFLPIWKTSDEGREIMPDLVPPLSTAAILSARFPWLTPPAYFYEKDKTKPAGSRKRKVRIVDGAYFENSGVVTALDLIKQIVAALRNSNVAQEFEINLLVFTSAEFDIASSLGLGEAMDPIRTMFNARAARAGIAVEEALETLKSLSTTAPPIKTDLVKLELNGYGYPLPLGWRLSPVTEHLISRHNGSERLCRGDPCARNRTSTPATNITNNTSSCAKRCVFEQLR